MGVPACGFVATALGPTATAPPHQRLLYILSFHSALTCSHPMKLLYTVVVIGIVSLTACSKKDPDPTPVFEGSWKGSYSTDEYFLIPSMTRDHLDKGDFPTGTVAVFANGQWTITAPNRQTSIMPYTKNGNILTVQKQGITYKGEIKTLTNSELVLTLTDTVGVAGPLLRVSTLYYSK